MNKKAIKKLFNKKTSSHAQIGSLTGILHNRAKGGVLLNVYGFTLIELLVVVLIIGILAAVALPQYEKAVMRARLVQYITRVQAISKANQLYYFANGVWADDVRDLDIDVTAGAVSFKKANWTQGDENVSAYYEDGTNCGPNTQGGAGCAGNNFFIYSLENPSEIYCRGHDALTESVCRSLAGGAEPVVAGSGSQGATYLMRF